MIPRVLEPEAMDTLEEALAYDRMDHSQVNEAFSDLTMSLIDRHGLGRELRVLDMGCGTAQIPICLSPRMPLAHIDAVDLADSMLRVGEENVKRAGLSDRIKLSREDCKRLSFSDATFHVVISNSLLHHVPRPVDPLREARRVLRPGGLLVFRDLCRPDSAREVEAIVAQYAADADDHQRELFRASLHAALTLPEAEGIAREAGMPSARVYRSSDRHLTIELAD